MQIESQAVEAAGMLEQFEGSVAALREIERQYGLLQVRPQAAVVIPCNWLHYYPRILLHVQLTAWLRRPEPGWFCAFTACASTLQPQLISLLPVPSGLWVHHWALLR